MADNKIQMPSSGGGLIRYFEESKSRFTFSPWAVVVIISIIAVLGIYFYKFARI